VSTQVKESEIPMMIDEIPILMVAASFARGQTKIFGLKELKVKVKAEIQDEANKVIIEILRKNCRKNIEPISRQKM